MTTPIGTPDEHVVEKYARLEEAKTPMAKIVKREWDRERPEQITFERLIMYHDKTPQIQMPVSMYAEMISGTDMAVTCESEEATELLQAWIRRTNFYEKFENMITTWLICGNALLEKLDQNDTQDILEVDMSTIISKKRDEYGQLEYYEHRTRNGGVDQLGRGNLGRFIEFNLAPFSRKAWSNSLFHSLAVPRTLGNRTMPPIVETIWGIEDAMGSIILNNAYPITTITYNGANDEYLKREARRWNEYKPGDKRVQKIKPEIEFFETQGNSKYTDYIDWLRKTIEMGVQFPNDILTGDFTSRASSETTETIVQKKVRGYQRYLSNKLKTELFDNILIQNGFDPEEQDCKVQFTTQNIIELEVNQVKDFANSGIMTKNEAREWLRKNTGMELEDDAEIETQEQEIPPQDQQESILRRYLEIKKQYAEEDYLEEDFGERITEATYKGRTVKLNKPFRTPSDSKKFAVYVQDPKTKNTKIVRFGDQNMDIKRDDPDRRKNFRARHNCDQHTDKTKAGYWSCKMWSNRNVSDLT